MTKPPLLAALWLVGLLLAGCGPSPQTSANDRLGIAVSILPQQYFVEKLGGERVEVLVLVEPGASAETYEPKPQQLRALSEADAYFRIDVAFEDAWFERIRSANSQMRIFDQAQNIEKIPSTDIHDEAAVEQAQHGDPHIWLSPRLVKVQAQNITEALIQLDPDHSAYYLDNLEAFQSELDELDAELTQKLSSLPTRTFLVGHPAWGYFARDYTLTMISIEVEGQEPSPAELAALVAQARQAGVTKTFAQPEFSSRTAELIAHEIGAEVVLISDLAPDWAENLRRLADALR